MQSTCNIFLKITFVAFKHAVHERQRAAGSGLNTTFPQLQDGTCQEISVITSYIRMMRHYRTRHPGPILCSFTL